MAAASAAALAIGLWATESLGTIELETVDARFSIRGAEQAPSEIVLLEIQDTTFFRLGEQWPFSRDTHARAIERLAADGAAVIAYDVQFTERSDDRRADYSLVRAADRAGEIVLATTEVGQGGESNVFGGDEILRRIGVRAGSAVLPGDADGVVREIPRSDRGLESFAVATVETWRDRELPADGFDDGLAWIDFAGPPGTFESIPFEEVVGTRRDPKASFKPGTFTDRVVVVGASASSLQDLHATSTTGDELMSGPEIQANAIASIDRGNELEQAPGWLAIALIAILAAIPAATSGRVAPIVGRSARLAPVLALIVAVGAGGAYAIAAQLAFAAGTILPVAYPLLALTISAVGSLAVQLLLTAIDRRRVRDVFARFVPERVVDLAIERSGEHLRLGGVEVTGTVLFSDIRGFTSFAERHPADLVIGVLNRYLTEMSDAILDHEGTIVSYMGDGIMAVFGAPIEQPDHADRAYAATRSMLNEKLPSFNAWLSEQGFEEFRMGIGLNTGPVVSGNVGSHRRLEYTAIGDTTNTASRLESMTKELGVSLVVSDSCRAALSDDAGLTFLDEVAVRGKQSRVRIYTLGKHVDAKRDDVAAPAAEPASTP